MEPQKKTCLICNSKATRRLHDEHQGFFLMCDKDVCEEVLKKQLYGAVRNQN